MARIGRARVKAFGGLVGVVRCRANLAHVRQSRPDSGLGFRTRTVVRTDGHRRVYRGTSLIRNRPPPKDHRRALDMKLL